MLEKRARTILAYHAVGECPSGGIPHRCLCVAPDTFSRQMRFLRRHRHVVSLADMLEGRLPRGRPSVAITFDDGYRNVLTNAAPILEQLGFVATMFVPTKWIGQENVWDSGKQCFPLQLMDEAELRESEERGIRIESHGHGHIDLVRSDPSSVADDLRQSVERLSEIIGRRPSYLAYPYGRQSPATHVAAEAAGFDDAFLFNDIDNGRFQRERLLVDGQEEYVRFWLKTSGGFIARRRSRLGKATASVIRQVVPRQS